MEIAKFKTELARVFDDNLKTKQWHNYLDWTIIALIVISTVEVFLSTFESISSRYGSVLHFIDVFTTIFFTIEVSLRIWCADLLDEKYKGFGGRVRYCFSFYGLIDILSTYPFYLSFFVKLPVTVLKTLRIARLLRVFRYMKSFKLLQKAVASKKKEMWISLQFLCIVTLILAFVLYFQENVVQPEVYSNGWKSVVWAFSQYIGDPGGFADYQPITFWGRIIASVIGILGIALFAVPAGLIGSGFLEAVSEDERENKIRENTDKLRDAFQRTMCRYTKYQIVPSYVSLADISVKSHLTDEEILEVIENSEEFRMVNLAQAIPADQAPVDKLAVEHFVVNRSYGCFIDRGSKVTIVSTSGFSEVSTGHFAYYLAKIGGFNFVGRELGSLTPLKSFYLSGKDSSVPCLDDFYADIDYLTQRNDSWVISILSASGGNEPSYPTNIHFAYGGKRGDAALDAPGVLLHNKEEADRMMTLMSEMFEGEFNYLSDRQQYHDTTTPKLFARHLQNVENINTLIMRIDWKITCWDYRRIMIAKRMAEIINATIDPDAPAYEDSELKVKAVGYSDYKN